MIELALFLLGLVEVAGVATLVLVIYGLCAGWFA